MQALDITPPATVKHTTVDTDPSPPRRSSSLHKVAIAKLRPLPFQYFWSVWHSKSGGHEEYQLTNLVDNMADIGAFYRMFNNVPWNQVRQKDSIHIFRSGVKPLWEDEENQKGGRWLIRVRPENGQAIKAWEEICLLCCGGELQATIAQGLQHPGCQLCNADGCSERDHILGMSFSPRLYFTHISIWTKQGDNLRSILLLERAILAGLSPELRPKSRMDFNFRKHADKIEMNSQSQIRRNKLPIIPSADVSAPPNMVRAMTVG